MPLARLKTPPIAVAGGAGVLAAWTQPWYDVALPPGALRHLGERVAADQLGPYAGAFRASTGAAGSFPATASDVLGPLALIPLVAAIVAVLCGLAAYTGRVGYVGNMVALCGVAAGGLTIYKIVQPPLPGQFDPSVVTTSMGAYVSLAAALLTTVGGKLIADEEQRAGRKAMPKLLDRHMHDPGSLYDGGAGAPGRGASPAPVASGRPASQWW